MSHYITKKDLVEELMKDGKPRTCFEVAKELKISNHEARTAVWKLFSKDRKLVRDVKLGRRDKYVWDIARASRR